MVGTQVVGVLLRGVVGSAFNWMQSGKRFLLGPGVYLVMLD
jgi:hypothetical protein